MFEKHWCRFVPDLLLWIQEVPEMPRKSTKKERGVFEKDPGSDIWWIRYTIDGRERREKVGRKKDASDLHKICEPMPAWCEPAEQHKEHGGEVRGLRQART